jgi:pimeloyl-ACP methyl ester carboxylesterase
MPGTFVLVHGGGHGGWCWQRVARALRAQGHEVHTPTLTGFGDRAHLDAVDFDVFVEDVASLLELEDLHDVVLVGHSMGGIVVPRVAERAPERIGRVVWLTACVAGDGESLLQAVPQTPATAAAVTIAEDGSLTIDHDVLIVGLLQDGTDADRAWVRARHRDYPKHALVEPGRLSAFLALGLPAAYVVALDDQVIPPELQRTFAARLGVEPSEVPGSHDCMVSRPDAVAAALGSLAVPVQ